MTENQTDQNNQQPKKKTSWLKVAAAHPDVARVVGVAEPREYYRNRMVTDYDIPPENVFMD